MHMKARIIALVIILGLLALLVRFPMINRRGELTEFTFAIAHQDMPSGFYYDRQFDWPTGEVSVLLDFPVWLVDALAFFAVAIGFRIARPSLCATDGRRHHAA
jgi:hypothetical protein